MLARRRREITEDDTAAETLRPVLLARLAALLLEEAVEHGRIAATAPAVGVDGGWLSVTMPRCLEVRQGTIQVQLRNISAAPLFLEAGGHGHGVEGPQRRQPLLEQPLRLRLPGRDRPHSLFADLLRRRCRSRFSHSVVALSALVVP